MQRLYKLSGWMLAAGLLVGACQTPADDPAQPAETASFDLLQQKVLTTSCATTGCHASEQDASYKQHGLVLSAGKAHANLVGITPVNALAKTDGLLRVKAFNAMQSLLYHKLNTDASHHGGKQYGNPMPLGREALSVGQIEFVRRWIEAGAPLTGNVVDATLLDDKTPNGTASQAFVPLPAPAAGEGIQMKLEPFDVVPNFEREFFVRKMVGNATDLYVKRVQIKMRPNSHHFIAYGFTNNALPPLNQVRDIRNPDGTTNLATLLSMGNHIFMAGTQTPSHDYTFPEGAALLIPAGTSLDLNSHYVNKSAATFQGEVYMNFYTVAKSQVVHTVKAIDFGNTSFSLPAGKETTTTKSFRFNKAVKVLSLTSHMHKLGKKFVIKINGGPRNGEVVYTSTDWEHPDIINLPTPISLQAGEGLTSEITYNNTTAKTVSFGLTSEEEMGIIFGYYYEE